MNNYIKQQMDENSLLTDFTIQPLLDALDVFEYYM